MKEEAFVKASSRGADAVTDYPEQAEGRNMGTWNRKGMFTWAILTVCLVLIGLWGSGAKADYGYTTTSMNPKMVDFAYEITFDEAGKPSVSIDYPFEETGANAACASYFDENDQYFELNFIYKSGALKNQDNEKEFTARCRDIQEGKASLVAVTVGKINQQGKKEGWGWTKSKEHLTYFEYSDKFTGFSSLEPGETRYCIYYEDGIIESSTVTIVGNGALLEFSYDSEGRIIDGYCNTPKGGKSDYDPETGLFGGKPVTEFGFSASAAEVRAPAAVGVSGETEQSDSAELPGGQTGGADQPENGKSGTGSAFRELIDSTDDTGYVSCNGFSIPVFYGDGRKNDIAYQSGTDKQVGCVTAADGEIKITTIARTARDTITRFINPSLNGNVAYWDDFLEDSSVAMNRYDLVKGTLFSGRWIESEVVEIDGHPAILSLYSSESAGTAGCILYFRNNAALITIMVARPPYVTMDDVELYASYISYDASRAEITQDAGRIELSTDKGTEYLTAGKKLKIKARFADEKLIKKQMPSDCVHLLVLKYEGEGIPGFTIPIEDGYIMLSQTVGSPTTVAWYIVDAETGETVNEGITVDRDGNVTTDQNLAEVRKVIIKAESGVFQTNAGYPLTVVPAASAISVEPAEVVFYEGTSDEQTLKAVLAPDTFEPTGILWAAAKKGIVDIIPGEGGTATVKPAGAGKTTVTVTEPGGKKATVKVSVVPPVTGIELKAKGKSTPGGTVTVTAALAPKNAGNKEVEWSLDVDETIATCKKGVIKISKNAPAGTAITVTCKALGAPEPIVETIRIEVAE